MLRYVYLLLAVLAVLALLWIAGEQHRENCIIQERASCSILPWNDGEPTGSSIEREMFGG